MQLLSQKVLAALLSHEAALQERFEFPPGVLIANASYAPALSP